VIDDETGAAGGTETGLEALVMERGMRRRKTVYEEFKGFNENQFDFIKAFKKD
jgi:hypothetical protein